MSKECYACRSVVPTLATRCPHCLAELTYGGGNPNWQISNGSGGVGFGIVVGLIVYGLIWLFG